MNSLKITYMILATIIEIVFLALAVAAPIWITPDYYWWTAFSIFMLFASSYGATERMNSWKDIGEVKS